LAGSWSVHYLALGGEIEAEVGWLPDPGVSSDQRIALGARPDLIMFAASSTVLEREATRGLSIGFGAATGPTEQGSVAFASPDGSAPGSVGGAQRTDAAILTVGDRDRIDSMARVVAIDSRGVSLAWARRPAAPVDVLYLAVAGARCHVGSHWSPATSGRSRQRWLGRTPRALLCFSWGLGASEGASDVARLSLGGASGPSATGAASWDDRDTRAQLTATHARSSTSNVLLVPDSQTGGLHASAALRSLDRFGFTLDWSAAGQLRRQLLYVALGSRRYAPLRALAARFRSRSSSASAPRRRWAGTRARVRLPRSPRSATGSPRRPSRCRSGATRAPTGSTRPTPADRGD
jgi:hypothetical protein